MSRKMNIHTSWAQAGESGLTRSSRLPSLSMKEIMLASRGVTAAWTRFQRVCLQQGQSEDRGQWLSTTASSVILTTP